MVFLDVFYIYMNRIHNSYDFFLQKSKKVFSSNKNADNWNVQLGKIPTI